MHEKNNKYFYFFNNIIFDKNNKNYHPEKVLKLFGNKGKNLGDLWHISNGKMSIPFGVVISYDLIKYYLLHNDFPEDFHIFLEESLEYLQHITGKKFGNIHNPLIVSIRSSGSISLPGILDTLLNVGITSSMTDEFLKSMYNPLFHNKTPKEQIIEAIKKIIESLNGKKLKMYFSDNLPDLTGGIIIQEMIFGNKNENSYTGVVFSSDPATGEPEMFGEFLHKCQGNLLVNGEVTPNNFSYLQNINKKLYEEIEDICVYLEDYFKYIQDIEFTVEDNKLYILQTRNGELSTGAKIIMGERLVKKNIISKKDFFKGNYINNVYNINENFIDEKNLIIAMENNLVIGKGLGITNSAMMGVIATSYEEVLKYKDNVIFLTEESNPNHMNAINLSKGLLTMRGGVTSHGAVVARGRNMVGILSVDTLKIQEDGIYLDNVFYPNGSELILDGNSGWIINPKNNLVKIQKDENFYDFLNWNITPIKVRINGETVNDMINGNKFKMDGIGLCRIEHMLLEEAGLTYIRNILKNKNINENIENLKKYLVSSFNNIFDHINVPMCIRLIDPPIHEFLPEDIYKEHNPMMGNRGARLMIFYEELCEIQIESIFTSNFIGRQNSVPLEIMVPFVFGVEELIYIKNIINKIHKQMEEKYTIKFDYKFGVMVELPRAVFVIEEIVKEVDFICFGTNDLTQMTFGLSRDDSNGIINTYMEKGILKSNPFVTLDRVIQLFIKEVVMKAKSIKESISIGICGEHAGDEESIKFLCTLPLNYISVSPFRVNSSRYFVNKYWK